MPAAVSNNLNRLVSANISAADLAGGFGWVSVNLDLQSGQIALIDGFDFHINVVGADYTNLQFVQVLIFKNLNAIPSVPLNLQIAAGTEQWYSGVTAFLSERVVHREYTRPLELEAGKYAVTGSGFFAAFVGPAFYELQVFGRVVAPGGKEFPLDLR